MFFLIILMYFQTANLLIQSAVQADEVKMEKGALRLATLEEVDNSVKLLRDMISQYDRASAKSEDRDAIKVGLYLLAVIFE